MKLYFMKQKALDYMRANIGDFYTKYYRESSNKWVKELFDYDPFEFFMEIPDFELASPSLVAKKGDVDLMNSKTLYSKLINISESQASDERLWAGLCHSVFYDYVVQRWDYRNLKFKEAEKDADALLSRFFFKGSRAGCFRNTLAKYWWVGKLAYQPGEKKPFEILDNLGADDFSTKVSDLFYSNTFSSNQIITSGISKAWKLANSQGGKLTVREYLRPALQYLNALGGGVLLDFLSEGEIQEITYAFIMQLLKGDKPSDIEVNEDGFYDEEQSDSIISSDIQEFREEFDDEKQRKRVGAKWKHITFGIGVVVGVRGDSVDIRFEDGKIRPMSYTNCWKNKMVELVD